jgi:hypothetical protein
MKTREEIEAKHFVSSSLATVETDLMKSILEVLLDIRDLLQK